MIKKWFEIIFDHRVSLQERMFRIVTGISMLALMFILLIGGKPCGHVADCEDEYP